MLNIEEYIGSGILEAYALGSLTEKERADVEANIALYPELVAELASIQDSMQHFAEATAQDPPAYMQEKIWSAMREQTPPKTSSNAWIIPLTRDERSYQISWQRAAVLIVLVGSVIVNFIFWNQRNTMQAEQLAMQQRMDSITQQQALLVQQAEHYKKLNDMIADSTMQTVVMQSMVKGHPMAATVYWSKNSGDAYVAVNKLPMPPTGMQYQVWTIQDGKPVSMGVLPNTIVDNGNMQKLAYNVKTCQAFAISLEKEGGNSTPTTVYVMGKVNS
jgi:anti-sigma-K factor RskA